MTQTMNGQNPQHSRNEIETHLVTKAWKDEAFKQQLLANPKAVIEEEFSVKLPQQLQVRVMEEDADTLYITLPAPPNVNKDELSEEELEAVAGGFTPVAIGITITAEAFITGVLIGEVTGG